MIELEISEVPQSLNVVMRWNWPRRHAHTKKWRKLVWVARCQAIVGRPTPIERAHVTIERFSSKLLDIDNLYGSVKPVVDALKCNELIVDDDPQHLRLIVTQSLGKSCLRVRIEGAAGQSCASPNTVTSQPCSFSHPGAAT